MSAALCVVVTVSTTVIHMNRLQTLRECLYQGSTQTCTCFAGIIDPVAMMGHHEGQFHQAMSNKIVSETILLFSTELYLRKVYYFFEQLVHCLFLIRYVWFIFSPILGP